MLQNTSQLYQTRVFTNYFKTSVPAAKYRTDNIKDIYDKGFRNVRLRCLAQEYDDGYDTTKFMNFLDRLTEVVDECIERDVAPIISWIHHAAEARANETDRQNYIDWWTRVAEKLKDRNYHLSFNLFTELGTDHCAENGEDRKGETCAGSLRRNTMKYNNWTSEVISAICATGENNAERIIILGAPEKTTKGLNKIALPGPEDRSFLMVEWHEYAAGPTIPVTPTYHVTGVEMDLMHRKAN